MNSCLQIAIHLLIKISQIKLISYGPQFKAKGNKRKAIFRNQNWIKHVKEINVVVLALVSSRHGVVWEHWSESSYLKKNISTRYLKNATQEFQLLKSPI